MMLFGNDDGFTRALDTLGARLAASEDPAELVQYIVKVRDTIRQLRQFGDDLEQRYCEVAPRKLEVAGIGLVQVKHAIRRTEWDTPEVLRRVVAKARDEQEIDPETGVVLEDPFSTAARVISDCASFSWKVTALRPRGIDPDDPDDPLCHVEVDHPAVVIGAVA